MTLKTGDNAVPRALVTWFVVDSLDDGSEALPWLLEQISRGGQEELSWGQVVLMFFMAPRLDDGSRSCVGLVRFRRRSVGESPST